MTKLVVATDSKVLYVLIYIQLILFVFQRVYKKQDNNSPKRCRSTKKIESGNRSGQCFNLCHCTIEALPRVLAFWLSPCSAGPTLAGFKTVGHPRCREASMRGLGLMERRSSSSESLNTIHCNIVV
jgi:hypothetical protein